MDPTKITTCGSGEGIAKYFEEDPAYGSAETGTYPVVQPARRSQISMLFIGLIIVFVVCYLFGKSKLDFFACGREDPINEYNLANSLYYQSPYGTLKETEKIYG